MREIELTRAPHFSVFFFPPHLLFVSQRGPRSTVIQRERHARGNVSGMPIGNWPRVAESGEWHRRPLRASTSLGKAARNRFRDRTKQQLSRTMEWKMSGSIGESGGGGGGGIEYRGLG